MISGTYRLQLRAGFGFAAAAAQAHYLADLGVSHVYLSPILQAVPGSVHGYDVTDHCAVSAELGGEDGFRAMAGQYRAHGLGIIVDVVPNHMAIPAPESLNRQLWSVLAHGQDSEYWHWFDVDWTAAGGRLVLPVLAGPPRACADDLVVDGDMLRYHEHVFPLRPGTAALPLRELLDEQHYELAGWREGATRLNYRRFFDITTLIGIRQESPGVFDATHQVLLRLHAEGLIDGFRIDHPDGLADPRGYLHRLRDATGGAWVVVEKILARTEELPSDWECSGTTGYDSLALVDGLFLDPAGAEPLAEAYATFSGQPRTTFGAVAHDAKRQIASTTFAPEVSRLLRLLPEHARDRERLIEVLAGFPVYRTYLCPGDPLPPGLDPIATEPPELITRFQQTTGPVVAKGVEDTACYRWYRLVSLNEVGSDPDQFGRTPEEFHAAAQRLGGSWPETLTTLSTHDTKRQEDVRARLAVLAEIPGQWAARVADWHAAVPGPPIDQPTEYLIWQTLTGAWPVTPDRLEEYLTKAVREAKLRSSWTDPDHEYEQAVRDFARRAPAGQIEAFVHSIDAATRVNSLGAKLIQLTMPGIPDVYQGCELAAFALTDPDNRREVDFARRRALLTAPGTGGLDGEKQMVTSHALRLRRDHPGWFSRGYQPLSAHGPAARHVIAFARGQDQQAVTVATRLPVGLRDLGGWADTALDLPQRPAAWRDVLTGRTHHGGTAHLRTLLTDLPVALLVAER